MVADIGNGRARPRPQPQDQALVNGPQWQRKRTASAPSRAILAATAARTAASACATTSSSCPLDDISNAACEAVAQQHQGHAGHPARLRPPAVRRGPRAALPHDDRHRRQPQRRRRRRHRHRADGWTQRVVDGIAKTGKPVAGFGIEGHGDIKTIAEASHARQGVRAGASELAARGVRHRASCGSRPSAARATPRPGLASCPTVGNMYDKLDRQGIYGCFGETSELTGAEHIAKSRGRQRRDRREVHGRCSRPTSSDVIEAHKAGTTSRRVQPTKGNIAGGLTTIEEKALGQPREDRQARCKFIDVLEPAEAPAQGPGLYFMDTSSAAAECVTLMAAARLRGAHLPDRAGQRHRQPDRAGHQDLRQPEDRAHDGASTSTSTCRASCAGEMTLDQAGDALIEMHRPHRQRPAHRRRGARPPRVLMTKLYRSA